MACTIRRVPCGPMLVLLAGASLLAQPRFPVFTAGDMLAVRTFAGAQPMALSPTGKWMAYVLTDMTDEGNILEPRPTGVVYVQPIAGAQAGRTRALTSGPAHSAFPVWSPDGRRLAFVREEAGGGRLAIWDSETDRTTPLGEGFDGRSYLAPQWDPSGARIVYLLPLKMKHPDEPARVRVVESTDTRIPGDQFFVDDRKAGLAVVDVASGKQTRLVEPVVVRSFRVSPSGRHLIYVSPSPETLGVIGKEQNETFVVPLAGGSARKVLSGQDNAKFYWSADGRHLLFSIAAKLLAVPVEGGEPRPFLEGLSIAVTEPIWFPDGARFVTLVPDASRHDPELEPVRPGMYTIAQPFMDLYLVSASDGAARNLTASFEDQVSDPICSPDGEAVYFRAVNNRTYDETIYRYTLHDQKLITVTKGEESYGRLSVTPGVLALTVEDATHPRDLFSLDANGGGRKRLTDLNPQLAGFHFSKPELFYYDNADGERLGALLYKPADVQPGQKVPVITWVYEKMTPDIHHFNARDQIFLTHGYAMLMPNVKVKVGMTAASFAKCVVPAVNAVREMGFTNGRFGLWGHSFGAYATSNLITQTDIFACAVSGATPPELFRNWASGRDRDSRNIETGQARMGGSPFEYPQRYWSQSAFFHLDQVNTPVLILHGEKDLTILFGEGEMMFYALRQLGKKATFVVYSNGDHSLSRHSRADTLDVNRRILDWFDKHLKVTSGLRTER